MSDDLLNAVEVLEVAPGAAVMCGRAACFRVVYRLSDCKKSDYDGP